MTWTRTLSFAWIGLVLVLAAAVQLRDAAPGDAGAPPSDWPAGTTLRLATDGPTLVMLAHPQCPCTVASLDELERLLAAAARPPRAFVVLAIPADAPAGFEQGAALERARRLTGAALLLDRDGREAARFGARTSGHVMVFDPAGRLRFAGGITPSRGRCGDAPGRRSVLALLGGAAADDAAPVFGCPLEDVK
jgi:hypothetical protein